MGVLLLAPKGLQSPLGQSPLPLNLSLLPSSQPLAPSQPAPQQPTPCPAHPSRVPGQHSKDDWFRYQFVNFKENVSLFSCPLLSGVGLFTVRWWSGVCVGACVRVCVCVHSSASGPDQPRLGHRSFVSSWAPCPVLSLPGVGVGGSRVPLPLLPSPRPPRPHQAGVAHSFCWAETPFQ